MKKIGLSFFLLFSIFMCTKSQITASQVSDAQAIFIYNFSRLIKWPANSNQGDFIIGVLGNSAVFSSLVNYTSSRKVGKQKITVKRFNNPEDISTCNILFVSFSKSSKMDEINEKLKGTNTLIIGERKGITDAGAGINFVIIGDRLKYEINKINIDKYNLTVSKSL